MFDAVAGGDVVDVDVEKKEGTVPFAVGPCAPPRNLRNTASASCTLVEAARPPVSAIACRKT